MPKYKNLRSAIKHKWTKTTNHASRVGKRKCKKQLRNNRVVEINHRQAIVGIEDVKWNVAHSFVHPGFSAILMLCFYTHGFLSWRTFLRPTTPFFSMLNYLFKNKSRDNYRKYNMKVQVVRSYWSLLHTLLHTDKFLPNISNTTRFATSPTTILHDK